MVPTPVSPPAPPTERWWLGWTRQRTAGPSWNNLVAYGTAGGGNAIFLAAPAGGAGNAEGASQYGSAVLGSVTTNDGSWHMVGLTVTGTNDYTLYVDGKLDLSGTMTTNTVLGQFYLGFDGIASDHFSGELAQAAIFNSALSAGQISALYHAATVPEPATLLLMAVGLAGLLFIRSRRAA